MTIRFLTQSQMSRAVDFMESHLGKSKKEIDFDRMEDAMNVDYRVGNVVRKALEKYYYFSPLSFEKILNQEELSKMKIGSPEVLRTQIFKMVSGRGGFVSMSERKYFMKRLEEEYGIPRQKLEQLIWLDMEENHVLKKMETNLDRKQMVEDMLNYYNYLSLRNLLRRSSMMLIKFDDGLKTDFVKTVYWDCKRMFMLCDFTRFSCIVYPPKEILPRNYGLILSRILRRLVKYNPDEVVLKIGRRKVELTDEILQRCLRIEPAEEQITFDSTIEENFARLFGTEKNHWKLVREPEPIITEDVVFIPDFSLERGDRKIYLEVIGFWTEEYRMKKREKLKKLRDLEIILLIDRKYRNEFYDIGFPQFYYKGGKFPVWEMMRYLSKYEEEEVEEKKKKVAENKKEITEKLKKEKFFSIKALSKIFDCYEEEVSSLAEQVESESFVFVKGVGLFSKKYYQSLIEKDWSGNLKEVQSKLNGIPLSFLENIGYKIEWKSLVEAVVRKT